MFESALSWLSKDRKAFEEKGYKLKAQYDKEKKEYQKLSEDKRESWLKEKGYLAEDFEDFNDDVLEDKIKYSKKSFGEQVDNVLSGADTVSTHLKVRETTPKVFIDIGLENKPILITSVHTKTAVGIEIKNNNTHNLSVETFKNLPNLLENPAIIMESKKGESVVAFVNALDQDNNPILCSIKINGKGNYNNIEIDANILTSVYGKDANPIGFIEKAVNENRVLYWDKKISQELFSTPGLQLPDNLYNLDSNTIIRQISKKSTLSDKFSLKDSQGRVLNKAQQDFFKDSKVVDENGNLRVVYHGTVGEFYTFDKTYLGSATGVGDAKLGFFFTSNKNVALEYALNAHDTKFYNLAHKIAITDNDRRKNI